MTFETDTVFCYDRNCCDLNLFFLTQMELLQNFYETTLDALKEAKNERLWFKTNTKLGKLYFDRGDFNKLQRILKQLHISCQVMFQQTLRLRMRSLFSSIFCNKNVFAIWNVYTKIKDTWKLLSRPVIWKISKAVVRNIYILSLYGNDFLLLQD